MEVARLNENKEMRKNCRMKSIVWLQCNAEYIWDGFAEIIATVWRCLARSEKSISSCSCGWSFCILVYASKWSQANTIESWRKTSSRTDVNVSFLLWDLASGDTRYEPNSTGTNQGQQQQQTNERIVRVPSESFFTLSFLRVSLVSCSRQELL